MSSVRLFASLAGVALGWCAAAQPVVPALRVTPLKVAATGAGVGFTEVKAEPAGVAFTNRVPAERYLTNQIYLNGSGVALGDIDGDGRTDLFLAAPGGRSALFQNLGGWQFTNLTAAAFPPAVPALDATGAVLADLDGDGDLDLVLNTVAQGTHLYFNDGRGRFARPPPPLNPGRAGMSLALADADGDGDLDLYVANYRPNSIRDDPAGKFTLRNEERGTRVVAYNGRPTSEPDLVGRFYVTPTGVKENGEPDVLFLNEGQGRFTPVSWTGGVFLDEEGRPVTAPPHDWGLSVLFRDLTGDGRPDLYVCNDFESPDRFWINETPRGGPLRLRAAPLLALRRTSAFAMGADAADVNRDGHDDFLVLDMLSRDHRARNVQVDGLPTTHHEPGQTSDRPQFSENTLFLGRGDGTFAELARLAGLAASEWSWTPAFLDVDLDGYEDLLISNGHEMDMMDADAGQQAEALKTQRRMSPRELLDLRRLFQRFDAPNVAFRNRGNLVFSDQSAAWGFAVRNVTHGLALADLDGDGDLDVVLNNLNAPPTLLRNDAAAPRVALRARAAGANTRGVGARLLVRGGPVPEQSQVLMAGGRYLSSDDPMRVFAAGQATNLGVEVRWPSGAVTVVSNVPPNSLVEVTEAADALAAPAPPVRPAPLFTDVSAQLNQVAGDSAFNDFDRQPLLPWSLAYPAPGATWADLDDDGRDDLLLGTGAGGVPAVFRNTAAGFTRLTNAPLQKPVTRDLTTLVALGDVILAGSSNYRDGLTNGGALRIYDLGRNASGDSLLGQPFAVGPLALGDVDGDGTPELFLGGRAVAGRYPAPAPSLLLKMAGGRFSVAQRFDAFGLVNSAAFAELDGDGKPDLLLATEWGPLRLFRTEAGKLVPWDPTVTGVEPAVSKLSQLPGWWTSVATGDFDSDGRLDFMAGNRGWNWFPVPHAPVTTNQAAASDRRRVYYGDFDGNGTMDLLESYFVGDRELPLRRADTLFTALPPLRDAFPTRAAFGAASLGDVLAALKLPATPPVLEARGFATTVFLNRGDHFAAAALPVAAQFAPVSGLAVADFDGDGNQDVFLAQNFFPVRPDEARQDAGRGLLLRGDGHGGFAVVDAATSGLLVWGDARAAAVADYDGDGRTDLAVTQNGGPTRLFHNTAGRPGVRVQLTVPAGNSHGVGAQLRLLTTGAPGPVQEVQAGSGWLSVDSPARVLTSVAAATAVEVRWPDGRVTKSPLPPKVHAVSITPDGALKVLP